MVASCDQCARKGNIKTGRDRPPLQNQSEHLKETEDAMRNNLVQQHPLLG